GSGLLRSSASASGCRSRAACAMATGRTFTSANPTRGPGNAIGPVRRPRGRSEVVQRVRDRAVDAHLEVQVRTEAQPGAAAVADDLALADARAERRREARLVRVARRQRRG